MFEAYEMAHVKHLALPQKSVEVTLNDDKNLEIKACIDEYCFYFRTSIWHDCCDCYFYLSQVSDTVDDLHSFRELNYNKNDQDAAVYCQDWEDDDMDEWGNVRSDI